MHDHAHRDQWIKWAAVGSGALRVVGSKIDFILLGMSLWKCSSDDSQISI